MEQSKFYQIKNITEHEYTLVNCDGSVITRPIQDVDKSAIAFTIKDAKDGDVLQLGLVTAIFQEYIGNGKCKCYCSICGEFCIPSQDGDDNSYGCSDAAPATKEQRDILLNAIYEAGYTFDFEKKELKNIVTPKFEDGDIMRSLEEAKEGITDGLPVVVSIDEEYYHCNNELISIKDQDKYEYPPMNRKQKPWSEEDEKIGKELMDFCIKCGQGHTIVNSQDDFRRWTTWLKSLKERYTWKPSDEQMDALHDAAVYVDKSMFPHPKGILMKLYKQLKKL